MQTGASIGLPHAYSEVVRAADDKASVELYTPYCRLVAVKQTNAFACFDVPHTERGITRPAYHPARKNISNENLKKRRGPLESIKTIEKMLELFLRVSVGI